jgi:N-acetyl-anhydromuramyl-L-alanine amidase AmpD
MTKPTHGGTRPNAGRKRDPNKKIPWNRKLDREVVAYLASCPNAAAEVEAAVRASKGFRAWMAGLLEARE